MKKIVEEVSGEGLENLLGERISVWCLNYIYAGKLIGVNEKDILLEDAAVVYETGELTAQEWKDAQRFDHLDLVRLGPGGPDHGHAASMPPPPRRICQVDAVPVCGFRLCPVPRAAPSVCACLR